MAPHALRYLITLTVLTGQFFVQAYAVQPLSKIQELAGKNVNLSALVVDLSNGRVLAEFNPDKRLTPASVTKLYIDAAALTHWGPNHRFKTPLLTNGKIKDGILSGHLMLQGSGDPGLNTEKLWTLVMRLRQMGIDRVDGNLIVNDSLFGPVECDTDDRCDALRASDSGYDAPISAAGSNFSTVEISVRPAKQIGQPAQLSLLPPALDFPLEGSISTASPRNRPLYGIRRTTDDGEDTLHAYGKVPRNGGPYHVYRSVSDPARHTGDLMAALMKESGIKFTGQVYVDSNPVPKGYVKIADTQSDTLSAQLGSLMSYSNNYMSDLLTMDIAAEKLPSSRFTLPQAAKVLEEFANHINAKSPPWLKAHNESATPLTLESGSGLSITNKLSARDLVALLNHMHNDYSLFPAFVGSLPVPRHATSRMLRRSGNTDWKTRLTVKTGYLSEPVSVFALSGYFRLKSGGWGAFAFLSNGTKKRRSVSTRHSLGALREDLQAIMAKY